MREKEPQFTVTDRRKFTSEGELREGGDTANPLVAAHPEHPVSEAFKSVAANVIAHLSQEHEESHVH